MTKTPPYTGRVIVEEFIDGLEVVPPGETYQATCWPERGRTTVHEVLIRDFSLVGLLIGNRSVETKERATIVGSHMYVIAPLVEVPRSHEVVMILKNETDRPLRPRYATFETEWWRQP